MCFIQSAEPQKNVYILTERCCILKIIKKFTKNSPPPLFVNCIIIILHFFIKYSMSYNNT